MVVYLHPPVCFKILLAKYKCHIRCFAHLDYSFHTWCPAAVIMIGCFYREAGAAGSHCSPEGYTKGVFSRSKGNKALGFSPDQQQSSLPRVSTRLQGKAGRIHSVTLAWPFAIGSPVLISTWTSAQMCDLERKSFPFSSLPTMHFYFTHCCSICRT